MISEILRATDVLELALGPALGAFLDAKRNNNNNNNNKRKVRHAYVPAFCSLPLLKYFDSLSFLFAGAFRFCTPEHQQLKGQTRFEHLTLLSGPRGRRSQVCLTDLIAAAT